MEWTEELITRLRDLWSQGLSTAEIGRQLSITKNAVVGKAHRLELPSRPSPIRSRSTESGVVRTRSTTPRKKKVKTDELPLEGGRSVKESTVKTTASVSSRNASTPPSLKEVPAKASGLPRREPPERKMAPPRRVREAMDRATRRGPSCQWPEGDPGTPEFHFCGATPLSGKPYCAEHAAVAYVKIRDRRH